MSKLSPSKPSLVQPDPNKPYFEVHGTEGPALVLIHGYMANRTMFDPLMPLLSGFRTVLIDNRGFGKSAGLPGPYSIEQMAADVADVLDGLGIGQAHVLGYSKGGLVAQEFALTNPERLHSLTLAVTFSHKIMSALERMQQQFLPTVIKRIGAKGLSRMLHEGIVGGASIEKRDLVAFRRMLADCRDDVLLQAGYALFKYDSRDRLHTIDRPTLVVGASDDIVVPIHHARFLAANIPNARLKVLDRGGHGIIYTHTQKLAQCVQGFLQEHSPEPVIVR